MRIGRRGDECLSLLIGAADLYGFMTWRKYGSSFEAWAYGRGFEAQLRRLEKRRLLESQDDARLGRVHRLTEEGRRAALGGRDPVAEWERKWDGTWRMVLFDVPVLQGTLRNRLRDWLRHRSFGCLQGSVWISPDPLKLAPQFFARSPREAASLVVLEGRPSQGERDLDLVEGAWDFRGINEAYRLCQDHWRSRSTHFARSGGWTDAHRRWLQTEAWLWNSALKRDPLLPRVLHPREYLGPQAWKERRAALSDLHLGAVSEFGRR